LEVGESMAGPLQDWKAHKRPFAAIAGVPIFWLALFFIVPMAIVWLYSFGQNVGPADIAISGTLDNYKRATEWLYLSIFLKSFAVAALVTLICLIVGFPVAMAITFAAPKWRPWLLLPFWTNLLIRTYGWQIILAPEGWVADVLRTAGWLAQGAELYPGWPAVLIALVCDYLPFMILPLYASVEKLDPALEEAAADLGASPMQAFWHVVLPQIRPGLVAGCVLVFLPATGQFVIPDLLGGAKLALLGNAVQQQFGASRDWPFGSAIAVAALLVMGAGLWLHTWMTKGKREVALP